MILTTEEVVTLIESDKLLSSEAKCVEGRLLGRIMFKNHFGEIIIVNHDGAFHLPIDEASDYDDCIWELDVADVPVHSIDSDFVKKVLYNTSFIGFKELQYYGRDKVKFVMFRSRGYEEEYTMNTEHDGWNKMGEVVFCFSDKYDNYTIIVGAYQESV